MLIAHTTSPQFQTEWGPAAQKTGENLNCGPWVKSASENPPLSWVGLPGGSPATPIWSLNRDIVGGVKSLHCVISQ